MKIDRHRYYNELNEDIKTIDDKAWLKEAILSVIKSNHLKIISEEHLDIIVNNKKYTKEDYLDIISLKNKVIAEDLRILDNKN